MYLSPAPMYHSAPLVYCMSMQRLGATVVMMEHFDPRHCLELIERHRVTHAQFVPTMFVRMLRLPLAERERYDTSNLDEDGYLYLTDRQAHMIISGGVNIYPQEAENVLASHPAVADVAVIGVPDAEMGERYWKGHDSLVI